MAPLIERTQPRHPELSIPIGLLAVICFGPAAAVAEDVAAKASVDQLQAQIIELRLHVQGMEGKLKESANARKAADQARMEAERRLAEVSQESDRLQNEMAELERRLQASEIEAARLADDLAATRETSSELSSRLDQLRALLPEAQGGTLTEETARVSAADAFSTLRKARAMLEGHASAATVAAVAAAELELRRRQLRLANVINAQSLYRIRPNDTLALIAARFYGAGSQWQTIFEANGHLLDDADRLTPGMTLVIP